MSACLADRGEKTMNQQRVILGLATFAVVGAGVWAWYGNSASPEATDTKSMAASPFRRMDGPVSRSTQAAAPEEAAAEPQPATAPADEDDSTEPAAAPQSVEPPSVDAPEEAQRKFAHGSKAEAEQI